MDIFIAICLDHNTDQTVRAFTSLEQAIRFCTWFAHEYSPDEKIEVQKLTPNMLKQGHLYYATYGTKGNSMRVEREQLDTPWSAISLIIEKNKGSFT